MRGRALAAIGLLAMAGCGDRSIGTAGLATPEVRAVAGSVALRFGSAPASTHARQPEYLSPSAVSAVISITGSTTAIVADVSASSTSCTATTTGRTCSIPVTAAVGNDTFSISLFAGTSGTGSLLGTGSATQTVVAGTAFNVQIGVLGSVASLKLLSSQIEFTPGTPATATVSVEALDAGGNAITGTYASPVSLTNTDASGEFTISPASVTSSGTDVTLTYNGSVAVPSATLSATSGGVAAANVAAEIVYAGTPALSFASPALPAGSVPNQFAAGPDGNEWYATDGLTTVGVGRIALQPKIGPSATGAIVEAAFPPDPIDGQSASIGIAAATDGNLYATNGFCTVFRVTPAEQISVLASVPACQAPGFLTQGPDGALWVVLFANGQNAIGRFPLSGAAPAVYPLPNPDGCDSYACQIVTGPDNALWFTELATGKIGRITTAGTITEYALPAGSAPEGITLGPDGALWFSDDTSIGRITTAGAVSLYPLPSGGTSARGIVAGVDGNLYFSASLAVGKVTPAGAIALYSAGGNGDSGDSIASSPGGGLFTVLGTGDPAQPYTLLAFPPQ